jgi:peptidyl-prolyl cis-trans isomerase D
MALIGKIRNNSWLLVTFIGMGLALFIVTSMFVGNQNPFFDSQFTLGSIDGNKVEWQEFTNAEDALYSNASGDIYGRRNELWNFFIEDALIKEEAEALGLGVGEDELEDLQFGNNLSPIITQRFISQQTGQVDREQLSQIRTLLENNEINPNYLRFWEHQKKEIIKARLQSKLNALVSKSLYTPTWMVEQVGADQNQTANFHYVYIPFDEIDNGDVELSDADYSTYLAENKAKYIQDEETRKIDYIVFEVKATKEDSSAIRSKLTDLIPHFEQAKNDTIFTENEYGVVDPRYFTKEDTKSVDLLTRQPGDPLSQEMVDTLFNAPIGSAVGPFEKDGRYLIAKLLDRRIMPDSAKSRHILINAGTPEQFAAAEKTIDSLKTLIETGTQQFDSLAMRFSQDPGSASKGGFYDYVVPNQFVPGYSDLIFFAGEIGNLYIVKSNYGVHLIEPMGRKFIDENDKTERIKVAIVTRPIVPSDRTQKAIYNTAQDFMATNRDINAFTTSAVEQNLDVETSLSLKANDYLVGTMEAGNSSRDIIRWVFKGGTEVSDVAPDVYSYQDQVEFYDNKYVVAALRSIQPAGTPKVANIKEEIEPQVYNLKKAEMIKTRISGTDLQSIASSFEVEVDTATNVNFNTSYLVGVQKNEPKVISVAFNLESGQVSQPVVGDNGVYIVKLINKSTLSNTPNIAQLRRQTSSAAQGQVPRQLIQAMKKNAKIKDNRSKFY